MEPRNEEIAALRAANARQAEEIAALKAQVAELLEKLGQNSRNSHLPPSSDGPGARGKSKSSKGSGDGREGKKRRRGGQRGHKGHRRDQLPPEQLDYVVDLFPQECESCWAPLPQTPDPDATRYQVTELPQVQPETTEYRRHAVTCTCGYTTSGPVDAVPASPFGPRLMSLVVLLTGVYHISRRRTVTLLHDVVGVKVSLGAVSAIEGRASKAMEPAVDEAWAAAQRAKIKHTDATSWLQNGKLRSLWTLATDAVTVFKILADGSAASIKPLFGKVSGILVSDRATVFSFWKMSRRQVCWAHLLRKFISFSERDGPAQAFGQELLDYAALLFNYWHSYQAGGISRQRFRSWMETLQSDVEACLQRAVVANIRHVSGSCADILAHKEALWTFVTHAGVEPTNNHAERELRAFVLWRKRCFGSQSDRGNVFAERVMTIAHTARKQNRNVLDFLTACCAASIAGTETPTLLTGAYAAA